jgi:hypothetical protein
MSLGPQNCLLHMVYLIPIAKALIAVVLVQAGVLTLPLERGVSIIPNLLSSLPMLVKYLPF